MARALSPAWDVIVRERDRRPVWRVLVYDVLAKDGDGDYIASIHTIVAGLPLGPSVGPRDFSGDVVSVGLDEAASDYAGGGVQASSVSLLISDPTRRFDPATLVADPTGDGRWLRRGNVVRVIAGDARIPEDEWLALFTGKITGQAGVLRTRVPQAGGPVSNISVRAVSREADYLRYLSTSREFAIGTTHLEIVEAIAEEDMGLDVDELDLASFSALATGHVSTQFAEEPPLVSVAKAMFPSGLMPKFRGDGRLSQTFSSITRGADRVYDDESLILKIETPFSDISPVNRVTVKGLDANLSRVSQPRQVLAEIQLTTGYFSQSEEVEAFWSDDRTIFADGIALEIVKSVNSGLVPLGGSETFSLLSPPVGSPEGTVGAVLEIDTGYAPELLAFFLSAYVVLSLIPDEVIGVVVGITVSVGRLAQATQLAVMMLIMLRVGRGVYRFVGEPFEYVYLEINGVAEVDGVRIEDLNELEIENHLVSTQERADSTAAEVLFREQAKGNPRTIEMLHDPALEPGDIVLILSTGRRYLVDRISYTLERRLGPALATLVAYEITSGSFL